MILKTDRFLLTPFTVEHISTRYLGWLNNKELMSFSEQRHYSHSVETARKYVESFKNSSNYFWAIIDLKSNDHIGNVNLNIDKFNLVGDIGILVGEFGYKGVATEVFKKIIKVGFEELNLRKITAGTMQSNLGMIKVMDKCHMKIEATRRAQFLLNDKPEDCVYSGILKEEYLTQRNLF